MPLRAETRSRRRRPSVTAALLGTALAGTVSCGGSPPLPVLGTVPEFALTERAGTPLSAADLAGHVWVADFIFTRCPERCPALTTRLGGLRRRFPDDGDPIRLVSFTVDPEYDTPEVLRSYAARYGASANWLFVTGPRPAIEALLRDGFKVIFADDGPPEAPITHSDRFVLVDRQGRVRGHYHGNNEPDVRRLARDALRLRAERPGEQAAAEL